MVDRSAVTGVLREVLSSALGADVERLVTVHGGDTAAAFRVDLASGDRLFAKTHPDPPPGFFTTEAASLTWMGDSATVNVPAVIAVSDGDQHQPAYLMLEWIPEGRARADTEGLLGAQLAALHDSGAPAFGRQDRRTTGSLGLPNEPHDTWAGFVSECRFVPLARIARDRRALAPHITERLERLATRLERFDDGRPPARLHGDLWAGNRLVDGAGESWLIDPAAHGGHAEFDLAMMRLFGGFGSDVFTHYLEHRPLSDGWQDRIELHQIAPLVVHAIKFGGGYVGAAAQAIDRYAR